MKIIKVDHNHNILNEDGMSAGFTAYGYNSPGFSYSILPLQFNLSQKDNDPKPAENNKSFKYFPGDMVKGYCPYDKKTHKGIIKYLYFTVEDNDNPQFVYIQDMDNNDTLPLTPDSVKKLVPPTPTSNVGINYLGWGSSHVGYDMQGGVTTPIKESSKFSSLMTFDNDEGFEKRKIDIDYEMKKQLYDFDGCKVGDIIYEDDQAGINRLIGRPVAECVIPIMTIDKQAHFVSIDQPEFKMYRFFESKEKVPGIIYRKWEVDEDGNEVVGDWKKETNGIKNTNKLVKLNNEAAIKVREVSDRCYVPSALELSSALLSLESRGIFDHDIISSTVYYTYSYDDDELSYLLQTNTKRKKVYQYGFHTVCGINEDTPLVLGTFLNNGGHVIAFYDPYKKDRRWLALHESNTNILSFNDDDIFDKSKPKTSSEIIDKRIYNFQEANIGDLLYYDNNMGYNTMSGTPVAKCCIPSGELDEYPRYICVEEIIPDSYFCKDQVTQMECNQYLKELEDIYQEQYINTNGRDITNALYKKHLSLAIDRIKTYGQEWYLPTTLELVHAMNNGIELENTKYYLTSTCYFDEIDNLYEESSYVDTVLYNKSNDTIDDILNNNVIDQWIIHNIEYCIIPFFDIMSLIDKSSKKTYNFNI